MAIQTIGARRALLALFLSGAFLVLVVLGAARANGVGPATAIVLSGTPGENGWYTSDVNVSFVAADTSGAGINHTEYRFYLNDSPWIIYKGPFNLTQEGQTAIYYRSVDNASVIEPYKSATVMIDRTPPALSYVLSPAPNANGWCAGDVHLYFNVRDDVSGVSSRSPDLTLTNEAIYSSLQGMARDNAGNTVYLDVPAFGIDKTPPAVWNITLAGEAYVGDYFPVSARVVEANPDTIEWDWGDGMGASAMYADNIARGNHAYQQPGHYTITLTVTDKAGHVASTTAGVAVYGTVPTSVTSPTPTPSATPTPTQVPLPSPTATPTPMDGLWICLVALTIAGLLLAKFTSR